MTIVDVARSAGVSRQTVSNVMNSPERVSPDTRERVERAMSAMQFRPNLVARSLRRERANALGVEVNSLGARRLGNILDSFLVELTIVAGARDSYLVPFAADDPDLPTPAYADLLASQLVDAFVLTDTRHDDPRPDWLGRHGVPFVSFGRVWDDPTLTRWADVDGYAAVVTGVRHLLEQGYRRIGFVGWPTGSPVGDDRRAGWQAATTTAGCYDPAWQASATQDIQESDHAAGAVIDAVGVGGAIICASDTIALGVSHALTRRGIAVGAQFGLVGFDDTELAQAFGLTSMRQPLHEVAVHIMTLVHQLRAGAAPPEHGELFAATVVERSSTRMSRRRGRTKRADTPQPSPTAASRRSARPTRSTSQQRTGRK